MTPLSNPNESTAGNGRRSTRIALIIVALVGTFYLATLREGHVWGDDFALYISHAKNLVTGADYADTGFTRSPGSISSDMYPPGYPLLLAPVYQVFGLDLTAFKIQGIAFFCIALFLIFLVLRQGDDDAVALWTIGIIGLCPYFWDAKDLVASEFPFMVFVFGALMVFNAAYRCQDSRRRQIWLAVLAGLLCFLAYEIRSVGLLLPPAMLVYDLLQSRRPSKIWVAATLVFVLGLAMQKAIFPVEANYKDAYLEYLSWRKLAASPFYYARCFSVLWENGHSHLARNAMGILVGALALCGGLIRFRKGVQAVDVFAVLYLLFIFLFPWGGRRYLIPILPIYVFYALLAISALVDRLPKRARMAAGGTAFAMLAGTFISKYSSVSWREIPQGFQSGEVTELVDYLKRETREGDVVVFRKPRFLALYVGVDARGPVGYEDYDRAVDFYQGHSVSHLVVSRGFPPRDLNEYCLANLVLKRPTLFDKLFENPQFTVYRLEPVGRDGASRMGRE